MNRAAILKFLCAHKSPGDLVTVDLGWDMRFSISSIPGGADIGRPNLEYQEHRYIDSGEPLHRETA